MKFLEKLALTLFSLIITVISITLILIMLNIIKVEVISSAVALAISSQNAVKITAIVTIVFLLLALKCIFFRSKSPDDGKNGITLENETGKLVISKESLESLIENVVKEVEGIETVASRTVLDKSNNVNVYVTALVAKDVIIKDVTVLIQNNIKDALKRTADLDVKQVNIRIKNIMNKEVKKLMPGESEKSQEE